MATQKIDLTLQEQRLRELLLDVANFIDEAKQIQEKLELRFAGGWVRDKLLDIPSHDIDTAINSMTGYKFCLQMQEYFKNPENLEKHSLKTTDLGNLHKIAANPEKSKHLETATIRIFGFDVDFVNLRKETYSQESRHPEMEDGTAEEDALRRDATINALFYNLHTDQVEDFCGGLEDLRAQRIRTPMEPLTTFTDDPLRVLRLIRFASRLGFKIDPETEASMTNPSVDDALKVKISRERVGIEIEKMLKGKNPQSALHLIDRLGLYRFVFTDPTIPGIAVPSTSNWSYVYNCLNELKNNKTPGSIYHSLVRSEDAQLSAWILAALTPWASIPNPTLTSGKLPPPFATLVAREGIKTNSKTCQLVTRAFLNYRDITTLKDAIKQKELHIEERDTLGMSIRRWDFYGKNWRLQALLALLVEAMNGEGQLYLFSDWQQFIDHLEKLDIMDAPSLKPLVDGNMLARALGGIKPGIWMKPALDYARLDVNSRNKFHREADRSLISNQNAPQDDDLDHLLTLSNLLTKPDRILRTDDENEEVNKLLLWISKAILPDARIIPQDEIPEGKLHSLHTCLHVLTPTPKMTTQPCKNISSSSTKRKPLSAYNA
ncbi:hypothetical protein G7Y89_g14957 [Cudoniella acicularis]|uniref:tRNA nucleotidyltransferase n=1 Tax=Cudoniella acicularis TaxID=354080 RepID=A0A8H4QVU4_9HELO|nr:hypothetical protein G7Y89_g14957 [Cudoniella acicularis]